MLNTLLYEDGSGGSLSLKGNDIETTRSLFTMFYIALFGGNVEADSKQDKDTSVFNESWWGNSIQLNGNKFINSKTERTLKGATQTSKDITDIKKAVKADLKRFEYLGKLTVDVTYPKLNWVEIDITIEQESNESTVSITWNATRTEPIEFKEI